MKFTKSNLRKIIRESLLNEVIFGAQAFVYHGSRTPPEEFQKIINQNMFEPGYVGGDKYGRGLYCVYEEDPDSNTFYGSYGKYVYKLKVNISEFLIFDSDVCRKVKGKWIGLLTQLEMMGQEELVEKMRSSIRSEKIEYLEAEPTSPFTSDTAEYLSKIVAPYIKGMIFVGSRDGKVALIYDTAATVLVSYKKANRNLTPEEKDSNDWVKLEISKDSISRSASGDFTPMRHNYPAGTSEDTASAIQYGLNETDLSYDDHEAEIIEKQGGLDALSFRDPKAWKISVLGEIKRIVDLGKSMGEYSERFTDEEIDDLQSQAFELAKERMI